MISAKSCMNYSEIDYARAMAQLQKSILRMEVELRIANEKIGKMKDKLDEYRDRYDDCYRAREPIKLTRRLIKVSKPVRKFKKLKLRD